MVKISSIFNKDTLVKLTELYFPEDNFTWTDPWWNLEGSEDLRLSQQKELDSEIGSRHSLWEFKPEVFALCDASDDVMVRLNDGRYACVHLVWHGKTDLSPENFPQTVIFSSARELQLFLDERGTVS